MKCIHSNSNTVQLYVLYTHKFRSWQLLGIKHLRFMGWPTRSISLNFMCNNPKHCSSNAISVSCRNDLHQRFVSSIIKYRKHILTHKSTLECEETLILYILFCPWRHEQNSSLKTRILQQNCRNVQYILSKTVET